MATKLLKRMAVAVPEGIAMWPSLDRPDYRFEKDGIYRCDVVMQPEEAEALKAKLEEFGRAWMDQFAQDGEEVTDDTRLKLPVVPHKDRDKQPTGMVVVRTKLPAKVSFGDDEPPVDQRPLILDPNGKKYDPVPSIWGGSKVRVGADAKAAFIPASDTVYVSLVLRGVQVIELVERGAVSEDQYQDYGFEITPEDATSEGDVRF